MRNATSLPLYLSSVFFILIFPFNISAQEYNDIWLRDWVNNQGISNTLAGRNLSVTAGDHVYEAVHQLNDDGQHDLVLSKSTLKGVQVWIDTFNLAATTANILLGDMILDGNDDILITGAVYNGSNNYDALTLKYTSAGSLSWYELYDGTASFYDGGLRIAVDANDNVFVTGGTSSTISNMDLLVLAYQSNGTLSWSVTHDGYGAFDAGSYVAAISTSTLHIVALSESTVSEKWHVLDRKYNSTNGSLIAGASSDEVTLAEVGDVTLDANDNIYITGWKPTTTQGRDIVVVKLDDGATIQWEKTFNGTADADDQTNAIAVATNGDVIVGGFTTTSSSDRDGLLLKYNSSGTLQWQQTISGAASGEDEITDVLIATGSSEIYLCGQIHEVADEDYLFQRRSSSTGSLLHELTFAGWVGGNDRAEVLLEDEDGGIIMSGKTAAGANGQFPTAVRFAKKDYFLPPNSETPNASLPYIHQYDQLTKTNGTVAKDIKYYAGNHYLENAQLSIVQARIDTVPTTPDTLCRVDVTFSDDKSQRVFALDKRSSYHNYYLGHINEGRTKVPLTDQVLHTDAWTGIDLLHGSNGAGHTYDIIIEPGVDPDDIVFTFTGHTSLAVNGNGELEITTALGTIIWPEPTLSSYDAAGTSYSNTDTPAYSLAGSNKVEITGVNSVSNRYLVIGVRGGVPTSTGGGGTNLEWCTYFGGNGSTTLTSIDTKSGIFAPDLFQTGYTFADIFPIVNGFQEVNAYQEGFYYEDAYLSKFDGDLNLVWSTFFGGTHKDRANDLLVRNNDVIIVGLTESFDNEENNPSDFPLFNNGFGYFDDINNCLVDDFTNCSDGFISVFSEEGQLNHSTFFGENGLFEEVIYGIAENDSNGDVFIVGEGFDLTLLDDGSSPIYQDFGLSFISKFNENLELVFSSKFNAKEIKDIDVTMDGNIVIAGNARQIDNIPIVAENSTSYTQSANNSGDVFDGFITKISPFPHTVLWSTYFGGYLGETLEELSVGDSGDVYIVGRTELENNTTYGDFPFFDPGNLPSNNIYDDQPSSFTANGYFAESYFAHFSPTGEERLITLLGAEFTGGARLMACEAINNSGEDYIFIAGAHGLDAANDPGLPVVGPTGFFKNDHTHEGNGNDYNQSDGYFLAINNQYQPIWGSYLGGVHQDEIIDIAYRDNFFFIGGSNRTSHATVDSDDDIQLMKYIPNLDSYYADYIDNSSNEFGEVANILARFIFDGITSIDGIELDSTPNLLVYPNPARDNVNIGLSKFSNSTVYVNIYNMLGQSVYSFVVERSDIKNGFFEFSVNHLPSGVYTVTAENSELKASSKLIRQ